MAGIGFQLARMAREGGVGGLAGAAAHGAVISAGPWLITAAAMQWIDRWIGPHLSAEQGTGGQTVVIRAFSLSALAAAPIWLLATRLVADRHFARDTAGVPGIMLGALAIGGALVVLAGALLSQLVRCPARDERHQRVCDDDDRPLVATPRQSRLRCQPPDVGSCREMVNGRGGHDSGVGGVITSLVNPAATAAGIVDILSNPSNRRAMGEVMRERVRRDYDHDSIIGAYRNLYRELTG
jgi:hypothetical protein